MFFGVGTWDTVDVMDSGDGSCCVILVDFVLGSNWDWDWVGIRSSNGHLNCDLFDVDFGRVLNGHLGGDFGDGAGGSYNFGFLDEGFLWGSFSLSQSHEVKVGDVSTSAQAGLHDGGSVSDDDWSLGVVNPGLEGVRDNMNRGRCGIGDWCWGSVGNWSWGSVSNWSWSGEGNRRRSSISNWGRVGKARSCGNYWCGNGSGNKQRKNGLLGETK